jgi:hypothetical protein
MTMMQLSWNKCQGDVWCSLATVNLAHVHFNQMEGVYIIWHGGPKAATVYVGQGNVRQRLTEHRNDPQIQAFSSLGLFVTWAAVPAAQRNGVEAYLARKLAPRVGELHPTAPQIEANLPW